MMNAKIVIAEIIFVLALLSCKKAYTPLAVASSGSYLVVEGTIVTGNNDSTIIKLSHTIKLSGVDTAAVETGAQVSVQDQNGKSYPLMETAAGTYAAAPLNFPEVGNYQLSIKRANGSTYLSDYVPAKSSPPIDSVSYQALSDGLHVYVNAHDATNQTRYYRWDYSETWEFNSYYNSQYIAVGDTVLRRTQAQQVYTCYQSDHSSTILLNSTTKLSQDVVSRQPITFVDGTTYKLNYIYSIQVRQYALTPLAFEFWQNLKRNTEQLGSIFDAQPSQLASNIHNTSDASEPVIGYISAGTISKQRVYASRLVIGQPWIEHYNPACTLDSALYQYFPPGSSAKIPENQVKEFIYTHIYIPINDLTARLSVGSPNPGFTISTPVCSDCTTRGTTVKPSFWPY